MRLRHLSVVAFVLVLIPAWLARPGAAAGPTHWADEPVAKLHETLGWDRPADLDAPIPIGEWTRLVAALTGVPMGDADPATAPEQHWVWSYSAGMARDPFVIRRQDAIGGLMKLASVLYKEKSFTAEPGVLDSFADKGDVSADQQVLVAGAVRLGLVSGNPEGKLNPTQPLTYGEGAALISRMLDRYGALRPPGKVRAGVGPQPRGFAAGTNLRLPPEQVINAGATAGAGSILWVINGVAYAAELPKVGPAPLGRVWVVVDAEVFPWGDAPVTIGPDGLHVALQDRSQVLAFEVDREASAALGSAFGVKSITLGATESLRGFLVFNVPVGMRNLWLNLDSKVGPASGKPGYNGTNRMPMGDLPFPMAP